MQLVVFLISLCEFKVDFLCLLKVVIIVHVTRKKLLLLVHITHVFTVNLLKKNKRKKLIKLFKTLNEIN